MATTMNVKLLQVTKTTAQWASDDVKGIIISKGLMCIEIADPTYTLTSTEPSDWSTSYTNYYTRSGAGEPYTYSPVTGSSAPSWTSGTYYAATFKTLAKIGDGTHVFDDLPYLTNPEIKNMTGASAGADGTNGFVPAPSAGDQDKYLAGDATWKELPVGALYKVMAGPVPTPASGDPVADATFSGSTDKIRVLKSTDGGTNWSIIDESGNTVTTAAGAYTSTLDIFATTSSGNDEAGKIKSALLPSYVDDIIEGYYNPTDRKFYTSKSGSTYSGEITPQAGVIYVDLDTDGSYRWSGSAYINISNPIDAQAIYDLMDTDTDGAYSDTKHGLVPAYGEGTDDDKKILRGDGWATLSGGTGITVDDSTTAHTTSIKLDAATASTIGGVSVPANSGLTLGSGGALSASVANASTLGSVKVGTGLSGTGDGTISVAAATSSILGGVKVADGSTISNTSGAIDVKVDGTTITKNSTTGALSAAATVYTAGSGIDITNKIVSINNTVTAVETETLAKFTYDANGLVKSSTAVADTSIVGSVTYDTANSKLVRTALDGTTKTDIVNVSTAVNTSTGTSSTDLITAGAVNTAIAAMDGVVTGSAGAGKTLTAFSETDGVVTATFDDISITSSQISNKDTTLVQSVSVNDGTAVTPTNGSINLSGIVKAIDYTNSSGSTTTLLPGSNGNIDLTQLTFNCVL